MGLDIYDDMAPGKPDISFYKKGKLMWLIDKTMAGKSRYSLLPKQYYIDNGWESSVFKSYENYLNLANTDPRYKYNNWRLPTKDEMLTLALTNNFWTRLLHFFGVLKNQRVIDGNIFYDDLGQEYWTTTKNKDGDYITIDYNDSRFKPPVRYGKGASNSFGVTLGKAEGRGWLDLRLVRDIK